MDPITIALALAKYVPDIARWMTGSDKAGEVAEKAIDIAKTVTGMTTGEGALTSLKADPALALEYNKAVLAQEVEFQKLAVENAKDVNASMQAEAAAEHWPSYSWRPMIGLAVALNVVMCSLTVAAAYVGVMFFSRDAKMLEHIPGMLGSMAMVMGVVMPVLGIASWFRGKMQADPNIPPAAKK